MQVLMERFAALVAVVYAWCAANPAITWPIVTALVTVLFKPRTPEQYAELARNWPRVAAFLQLLAALGFDPVKALKIVSKVFTGRSTPPPPPKGPSILPLIILGAALSLTATACTPSAWLNAAELLANKIACAVANQDLPNEQIIEKCAVQPGDVERVLAIVGESRQASAKAAADASARASAAMCPDADAGAP